MPNRDFYTVGGTIHPGRDNYVVRAADDELFEQTKAGQFCYVLSTRQMGKSSLMARTAARLKSASTRVVTIDVTQIGSDEPEKWYYGVVESIAYQLDIDADFEAWWDDHLKLPVVQRLTRGLREFILEQVADPIVVFIDEIDSTINLPFTDDFFAAIRACFNARATDCEFQRLTFVFLGVASPSDLIADRTRTPFNIGTQIDLTDFTVEEARPLIRGFGVDDQTGQRLINRVLYWTGGHPYLTQRTCAMLCDQPDVGNVADEGIDQLVHDTFLADGAFHDEKNLSFVHDRLSASQHEMKRRLLATYGRILDGKPVTEEPLSPVHNELKLSGVVKARQDKTLIVRNRIYESVFDDGWLSAQAPRDSMRRVAQITAALLLMSPLIFGTYYYEYLKPSGLQQELAALTSDFDRARSSYEELKSIPFYSGSADEYWRDFLKRHFQDAENQNSYERAKNAHQTVTEELPEHADIVNSLFEEFLKHHTDEYLVVKQDFQLASDTLIDALEVSERHHDVIHNIFAGFLAEYGKTKLEQDDFVSLRTATETVDRRWPTHRGLAHQLFAQLCEQTAVEVEQHGTRTAAVLWRAKTHDLKPSHKRAVGVQRLTQNDYPRIVRSFHHSLYVEERNPTRRVHESSRLSAAVFSPDGSLIATAGDDGIARVWIAETGSPVGEVLRHDNDVRSVVFSPDGTRIATAGSDYTARIWDSKTGNPLTKPMMQPGEVYSVVFNHDGTRIATACDDGNARIWDAETGEIVGEPLKHRNPVTSVAFNHDGTKVVTGCHDGTARIWDSTTGKPFGPPLQHEGDVAAVVFNHDGSRVATGSFDETGRIWNVATGMPVGEPLKHTEAVLSVAFNPDGTRVATASSDGTGRVWDAATGLPVGRPLYHDDTLMFVEFSPDGTLVATSSDDGSARIWDAVTGLPVTEPLRHGGPVWSVIFDQTGKRVLTASDDGTARIWEVTAADQPVEPFTHPEQISDVAFDQSGERIAIAGYDFTAQVWEVEPARPIGDPLQHQASISAMAFSHDGTLIATGTQSGSARIWNAQTGQPVCPPLLHSTPDETKVAVVKTAKFIHGDTQLVTESGDGWLRVWDVKTGQAVYEHNFRGTNTIGSSSTLPFVPNPSPLPAAADVTAAMKQDGTIIANTGSGSRPAGRLNGKQLWTTFGTHRGANSVVFDEKAPAGAETALDDGGAYFATVAYPGEVHLWNFAGGLVGQFQQQAEVKAVAFSQDRKRLITSTAHWLRWFDIQHETCLASRYCPETKFLAFREVDDAVRVAVSSMSVSCRVETIHAFVQPDELVDPNLDLSLKTWQDRLALDINDEGQVVPRFATKKPPKTSSQAQLSSPGSRF